MTGSCHRVEIRGQSSDDAVLVTGDRSYSVKLVETSNTLLLVADQKSANNVATLTRSSSSTSVTTPSSSSSSSSSSSVKRARLDIDGTAATTTKGSDETKSNGSDVVR
jgi:hypothetical protein